MFKKVTGLDVKDFELLVSPGVFNDSLMNDAVFKFKRYEDSSLNYTGINRHQGEKVGGYDTVVSNEDYSSMFLLQQASMEVPEPVSTDPPDAPVIEPQKAPTVRPKSIWSKPTMQSATAHQPQGKQIDASSIKVGSFLYHKAFGMGTVKTLTGERIVVTFDGNDKPFQFPGAILQGFLNIPE